jgi:hypothetical protein
MSAHLIAEVIQRRCSAVLYELETVAGDELRDELAAIQHGHILTTPMRAKMAAYLRDEMADGGMLSREQLRENYDPRGVNGVLSQARTLYALVQEDDES